MYAIEDATVPLAMSPGATLFRGLNAWEEQALARDLGDFALTARSPIHGDVGWDTALNPRRSRDHVLLVRRDLLSLSLQRATAVWYASHELLPDGTIREKVGTLVTVVAPDSMTAELHGDERPAVWIGLPGAVLLDPRYVLALDEFDAWLEGRSRSRRDHEVLLASGNIVPIKIERVTARDCAPGIVPWAMTRFSNPRFR